MSKLEKLAEEIRSLTPEDRRVIAEVALDFPIDSDEAVDPVVEAAWEAEIDRRIEAIDNGTVVSRPWAEVKRDLEREFTR